jgi:cytochrome P450
VLGNLPGLLRGGLDYVEARQRELGDLYRLDIGPQEVVLLNHPDHAKHVLIDHVDNYLKEGTFWSSVRSLIGLGLPTIEGDVWRKRRRMMNPQFRRQRLMDLGAEMVETIDAQLDTWPTGGIFDAGRAVSRTTMAVIVRTMFGTSLDPEQANAVADSMSFSLDHMLQRVVTDALPSWMPVPGRRAHRESVARIDAVLYELIERRRRQDTEADDLLGMMLEMRDEGAGLSDEELRDETMSLFVAGFETTASSVSWGLARMALDPSLYEPLAEEVDRVLGGRPPTVEDLPQLQATERYFMETLRLDGPVFFLPRTAVADDVLGGTKIPAGTMVSLMLDRIHRHPDVWEDPDRFDPDRFSPERSAGRHPCAWIPFGAGRRVCIGKSFALMEGVFLLASIVQRYSLEPTDRTKLKARLALTKRPRDGVPLRLVRRGAKPTPVA